MEEENVNESSEEQQENASPAEKPEFPPEAIAVISGLREDLRMEKHGTEVAMAELRGQINSLQQVNVTQAPAAKSPFEIRAEEEGVPVAEIQVDGALYQAQTAWDKQQENARAQAEADKAAKIELFTSMTNAKAAHDDWQAVVDAGDRFLTAGERLDVENAGANFGEVAYKLCQAARERNKPVEKAAPKLSESEQKAKDEADAAKKAAEAEKARSQTEILADAVKSSDPHADFIAHL
jgi:hypothetical protein